MWLPLGIRCHLWPQASASHGGGPGEWKPGSASFFPEDEKTKVVTSDIVQMFSRQQLARKSVLPYSLAMAPSLVLDLDIQD